MENIFDLNNWLIILAAFVKILTFFWPILAMFIVFGFVEWRANREIQ